MRILRYLKKSTTSVFSSLLIGTMTFCYGLSYNKADLNNYNGLVKNKTTISRNVEENQNYSSENLKNENITFSKLNSKTTLDTIANKYHNEIIDLTLYGMKTHPGEVYSRLVKEGTTYTKSKIKNLLIQYVIYKKQSEKAKNNQPNENKR